MRTTEKVLLAILVTVFANVLFTTCLFAGSLVAYWNFEEGSGKVLEDQSGLANDGQVSPSCKWVNGKFGKGMEFNGVDSFVLVKNNDSYNFNKGVSFSISMWINYTLKGDYQGPLQKFNGGYPFKVEVNPSNQLYFSIWDQTNNPGVNVGNINGDWHHCCFTRDVSSKKLFAYVDGTKKAEAADTVTAEIANSADLYIGARKPGNTITYKGMLDEIAIYSRVLTDDEIMQASNGKLPEVKNIAVEYLDKLASTWGNVKKDY